MSRYFYNIQDIPILVFYFECIQRLLIYAGLSTTLKNSPLIPLVIRLVSGIHESNVHIHTRETFEPSWKLFDTNTFRCKLFLVDNYSKKVIKDDSTVFGSMDDQCF